MPSGDIARATDHFEHLIFANAHLGQLQTIGARVRRNLKELAYDHLPPVATPSLKPANLKPAESERIGELLGGELHINELAKPGERHPHRRPRSMRRSFSRKARRSGISCRSIAIRSTPSPNAKP